MPILWNYIYKVTPLTNILLDFVINSQNFFSSPYPVLNMIQKNSKGTNNSQSLFFGSSPKREHRLPRFRGAEQPLTS